MKKFILLILTLSVCCAVQATVLFEDDFETGLGKWTGKNMGPHDGAIVQDPLDAANSVLTFTDLDSAGNIFTSGPALDPLDDIFILSFRYLGTCQSSDCGGYVGYSDDFPGAHNWHYATGTASGAADVLIDDGVWRMYSFTFNSSRQVHIMIEDFTGSGGIAGDAYFDDFRLTDGMQVPEPATLALFGLGLAGLGFARRNKA